MRLKLLIILSISSLFFMSCKSNKVEDTNMYIMIYDFTNKPVQEVNIFLDNKLIGTTDVYGRFIMSDSGITDEDIHILNLKKNNYKQVIDEISYNKGLVFYYKMGNSIQYLYEAEKNLDDKNYTVALDLVNESLDLEIRDDALYLKSIILNKLGMYEDSVDNYKNIKNKKILEDYKILGH